MAMLSLVLLLLTPPAWAWPPLRAMAGVGGFVGAGAVDSDGTAVGAGVGGGGGVVACCCCRKR
jgi:hypothetical protein